MELPFAFKPHPVYCPIAGASRTAEAPRSSKFGAHRASTQTLNFGVLTLQCPRLIPGTGMLSLCCQLHSIALLQLKADLGYSGECKEERQRQLNGGNCL